MSTIADRVRRAVTENHAETAAAADDPRLRGRTYGIPFDDVWRAALSIVEGHRNWHLVSADDEVGHIVAEAMTPLIGLVSDVEIDVGLDEDAQTRVDMRSRSRKGRGDLGMNARRIASFCRSLDTTLAQVTPREFRTGGGPAEPASR